MRLEQTSKLKQKIEELLSALIDGTEVTTINWEVQTDIAERKITVVISPKFKELAEGNKFGTLGEKGSDELPKIEFKKDYQEE